MMLYSSRAKRLILPSFRGKSNRAFVVFKECRFFDGRYDFNNGVDFNAMMDQMMYTGALFLPFIVVVFFTGSCC